MDIPDSIIKKLCSMGLSLDYTPDREAEEELDKIIDTYCRCDDATPRGACGAKIPVRLAILKRLGVPDADAKAFSDAVEAAGLPLEISVRIPTAEMELLGQAVREGALDSRGDTH